MGLYTNYTRLRGLLGLVSLGAPIFFVVSCMLALTEKTFMNYMVFGWSSFAFAALYLLGAFMIGWLAMKKRGSDKLKDDFTVWSIGCIAYAVQAALALFRHHHQVEADYVEDGLPSEVSDYSSIPMALADARFEALLYYGLAMNTLFFSFWYKFELVNSIWRGLGGSQPLKSGRSDTEARHDKATASSNRR